MPDTRPLRVLVVDDHEGDALLISLHLERDPRFSHEVCRSLSAAKKAAASSHFDVALLDLSLPDSEGIESFHALQGAFPAMPVVILTGSRDEGVARAAIRAGAIDFLGKHELTSAALLRTLRFAVERHESRRDILQYKHYLDAVGQAVIALDPSGTVRYWNYGAETLYGWSHDEALGRPLCELRVQDVGPEEAARRFEAALAGQAWSGEVTGRRKDGVLFQTFTMMTPTRDGGGRIAGVISVSHDISESKRLEAQLRDAVYMAKAAQQIAQIHPWRVDFTTGETSWPLTEGYSLVDGPSSRKTEDTFAFIPEPHRKTVMDWLARVREAPEPLDAEIPIRGKDGQLHIMHNIAHPILNASGAVVGVQGVARDITQQRAREAEVERARSIEEDRERLSALGTLVAGVAHEINNPLSYVQLAAELARMTVVELRADDEPGRPTEAALRELHLQLDAILKGVGAISSITKALKQISRAPTGVRREENLAQLVEQVVAVARSRISPKIELWVEGAPTAVAQVNCGQIAQVILNLLLNAGDAIGDRRGSIRVHVHESAQQVILRVADDGPGIPPDVASRLFTPFFTTKAEGTGLGLSLSRRIVQDHGGELSFEPRPGGGTVFRILLPRRQPDADAAPAAAPSSA
ncbi:MAG TPA: ATP-binding protein [Candidatus Thermoplasmatota archaeon]|nr:ATP-binding protein [Candidatus Thermoplasmatota archaeon]